MASNIDFLNAIRMGLNPGKPVGQQPNQMDFLGNAATAVMNYQGDGQERHSFFTSTDTGTPAGGFTMPAQRRWNK